MIVQDSYTYIQIGLALRLLRNVSVATTAALAKKTIETLKANLQKANFDVSIASLRSISFGDMERLLKGLPEDGKLTAECVGQVTAEFKTLENIVFAEAITKKVYILPTRRFNTDYLLTEPNKLLRDGAFEKLEEIARSDFASSCRCILFGEATAAAFHVLRATESVLKSYYFHHRKRNRLAKPMWGPMLDQLKAKSKNPPPSSLLATLDNIRSTYRNPTQHPEALYEIDSAQDLFGVCIDVIGKMTDELGNGGA